MSMTPDLLAFIAQTSSALIAAAAAVYAARLASAARSHADRAADQAAGTSPEFETAVLDRLESLRRTQRRQELLLNQHLAAHASGDLADSL